MKKRLLSLLLALTLCLGLLPATAFAVEADLPDWYFLFAIFKNVDADYRQGGVKKHVKHTMTQDEIDFVKEDAQGFEEYMNQTGVMRAHVDVVEIDAAVRELEDFGSSGGCLSASQAASLLKDKVDLDQYDHVTCVVSLNDSMGYLGLGGTSYENGTGHTCINLQNREYCMNTLRITEEAFPESMYVHELLHFMANVDHKWGTEFNLHDIRAKFYAPDSDNGRKCYTDIILDRARGDAGTGVHPAAWQYPPHVLRTIRDWTIPSGVTSIGRGAFQNAAALTRVTIPGSAASIEYGAFQDCAALTEVTMSPGVASIGMWVFGNCAALTRVVIPASVTSIGYAAFWKTGLTDVYYGGTEAQWEAIQIDQYNDPLTKARIHYNSSGKIYEYDGSMSDVKSEDWFAVPVQWALEEGFATGTGDGKFSPYETCTQGQILTFLWRAKGSPTPAGTVSGSEYYAAALQWAGEQQLIDEDLGPESPCTRADVVTYLWKLAGNPAAGSAGFSDVPDDAVYTQAVAWAVEHKITSGIGDGKFSPDEICTRGQIAAFLYNALV